jgi:hypothetical protein
MDAKAENTAAWLQIPRTVEFDVQVPAGMEWCVDKMQQKWRQHRMDVAVGVKDSVLGVVWLTASAVETALESAGLLSAMGFAKPLIKLRVGDGMSADVIEEESNTLMCHISLVDTRWAYDVPENDLSKGAVSEEAAEAAYDGPSTDVPTLTTEYFDITDSAGNVIKARVPFALRDGELTLIEAVERISAWSQRIAVLSGKLEPAEYDVRFVLTHIEPLGTRVRFKFDDTDKDFPVFYLVQSAPILEDKCKCGERKTKEELEELIPDYTRAALERYVDDKCPTGGFLYSVLAGFDWEDCIGRADSENKAAFPYICDYINRFMPADCWGSPEKVNTWLYDGPKEEPVTTPEPPSIEELALFSIYVGRCIVARGLTVEDVHLDFAGKVAVECHYAVQNISVGDDKAELAASLAKAAVTFVTKATTAGLLVQEPQGPYDHIRVGNLVKTKYNTRYKVLEAPASSGAEEGHIAHGRFIYGNALVKQLDGSKCGDTKVMWQGLRSLPLPPASVGTLKASEALSW